jgi:hypothetical protein
MIMSPESNKCRYIIHGRDSLSSWVEARAVTKENMRTVGKWLLEDVLCRWGIVWLIVTDNAPLWLAAVQWLSDKYGIVGISITPYNSQGNGKIERPHWDLRQMLYKSCGGDVSKWWWFLPFVLWADRITIRKRFGCSPFFLTTGAHPILALDVDEATWLVEFPDGPLSTADLIGYRARALAKHQVHLKQIQERVSEEKRQRVIKYEREHRHKISDRQFVLGDLVLVRNSPVEGSLDSKLAARFLGPYVVVRRSRGGSYLLCELDGSMLYQRIAAFRVFPYFARERFNLPKNVHEFLDVTAKELDQLAERDEDEIEAVRYTGEKDIHFEKMPGKLKPAVEGDYDATRYPSPVIDDADNPVISDEE